MRATSELLPPNISLRTSGLLPSIELKTYAVQSSPGLPTRAGAWYIILGLTPTTSTTQTNHTTAKMFGSLTNLQPRQLAAQVLNFALVLSTAFMLWKGLSVFADSSSPIVVVLSGSMEPAFQRGDLLFLWNRGQETQVGEVVVYNVRGKDIPIVHRVIRRFGGG